MSRSLDRIRRMEMALGRKVRATQKEIQRAQDNIELAALILETGGREKVVRLNAEDLSPEEVREWAKRDLRYLVTESMKLETP